MKKTRLIATVLTSTLIMMSGNADTYNYTVDIKNGFDGVLTAKDQGAVLGTIPQNGEQTIPVQDNGAQLTLPDANGVNVCNPDGSYNALDMTFALNMGIRHFTVTTAGYSNGQDSSYSCNVSN